MPEDTPTELDFSVIRTPVQVSNEFPEVFSKWGLIRLCREREHNGLEACGAAFLFKNKVFLHVPKLLRWFEKRFIQKCA